MTAVSVLACAGCFGGSGNEVKLGKVSGVVTMDGKPLSDAIVVFKPETGNPSSGRTGADGSYELIYLANSMGALVGKHKVSITTADPVMQIDPTDPAATAVAVEFPQPFGDTGRPATRPEKIEKKEPIPAKYNSKTELTAEVASGKNTHNFDLKAQ